MSVAPVIMWFRRDLRLIDNKVLDATPRSGSPILPVFVFEPAILKSQHTEAVPSPGSICPALARYRLSRRRQTAY